MATTRFVEVVETGTLIEIESSAHLLNIQRWAISRNLTLGRPFLATLPA